MRRLLIPAMILGALAACGLDFSIRHADRVDPGKTLVALVELKATAEGSAEPTLCLGGPTGWTTPATLSYTLNGVAKTASSLPADGKVQGLEPELSWTCWQAADAAYRAGDTAIATVEIKVPKAAKGTYQLHWIAGYDLEEDGPDANEVQVTRVFVGSAGKFAKERGPAIANEMAEGLRSAVSDTSRRRLVMDEWRDGKRQLTVNDLADAATAYEALSESADSADKRLPSMKLAGADKKRVKAAIAEGRAEIARWTWSPLLVGAGGHMQSELEKLKNPDGSFASLPESATSEMASWLRAFDTVASVDKNLDPTLDLGLMEVALATRYAAPERQREVYPVIQRLAKGKEAKALGYFLEATSRFPDEGATGTNVRAACSNAMTQAVGTDLAAAINEACAP